MKYKKTITILVICIAVLSFIATAMGILSGHGPGPYEYTSIRGETVMIHGQGIYQHMSAELAPQGIAQDVVTMLLGIPVLLISLYFARKGSLRGRILLAGTLGYFLVTYLFWLVMVMYNQLFLVYVVLLSASFFAFALNMLSLSSENLHDCFDSKAPAKFVGGFLIFNAVCIGLLWLSIVAPSLINGAVPVEVEHYTTLIVQGLDLSILLPLSFVSGLLLFRREPSGYLLGPVYIIFLSFMMTALSNKILAMSMAGISAGPAIVIIPLFNLTAVVCAALMLKNCWQAEA